LTTPNGPTIVEVPVKSTLVTSFATPTPIVTVEDFVGSAIEVAVTVIVPIPVATTIRANPEPERVPGPEIV
jgi:hypothetical protein